MHADNMVPPVMADLRRPQLFVKKKAGIVTSIMRIEDSPEAKKDASELERPAWLKSVGAYFGLRVSDYTHCCDWKVRLTYKTPSIPDS